MTSKTGDMYTETTERITFEISGDDLEKVRKFREQHQNCARGMAGEQFEYSFAPSGLGVAAEVKCSCGQTLELGDFTGFDLRDYDPHNNRVLSEADRANRLFEEAAVAILRMKSPRDFRHCFSTESNFEMIYSISTYGIANFSEERIKKCILYKFRRGEHGEQFDNYAGLDEAGRIKRFFDYFEERVKREIGKYECSNDTLLGLLS